MSLYIEPLDRDVDYANDPRWQNYQASVKRYTDAVRRENAAYLASFNVRYDRHGAGPWGAPVVAPGTRVVPIGDLDFGVPGRSKGAGFALQRFDQSTGEWRFDTSDPSGFQPAPVPDGAAFRGSRREARTAAQYSDKASEVQALDDLDRHTDSLFAQKPSRLEREGAAGAAGAAGATTTTVTEARLTPASVWERLTGSVRLAYEDVRRGESVVVACTKAERLPWILTSLVLVGVLLAAGAIMVAGALAPRPSLAGGLVEETLARLEAGGRLAGDPRPFLM
jgi:hypothetical protein